MKIIRWITFLPLAAITIALAQIITGTMADHLPWWVSIPIVLFFGIFVAMATACPVMLSPDPKVGAAALISLYLLLEIFALLSQIKGMNSAQLLVRILTDLFLVLGGIMQGKRPPFGITKRS